MKKDVNYSLNIYRKEKKIRRSEPKRENIECRKIENHLVKQCKQFLCCSKKKKKQFASYFQRDLQWKQKKMFKKGEKDYL